MAALLQTPVDEDSIRSALIDLLIGVQKNLTGAGPASRVLLLEVLDSLQDGVFVLYDHLNTLLDSDPTWAPPRKTHSGPILEIELPAYLIGIKLPELVENAADNG